MSVLIMPSADDVQQFGKPQPVRRSVADIKPVIKPIKKGKATEAIDLTGHTLMLNTAMVKKFQCGGFSVGPLRPFAAVSTDARQAVLRQAINDGQLIDITGQDPKKGVKGRGGQTTGIEEVDTGKRVFLGQDGHGNTYIVTPKNKTEQKRMEREIARTGTLSGVQYETSELPTSISAIHEEPLLVDEHDRPLTTKKKAHASTSSPKRKSRG